MTAWDYLVLAAYFLGMTGIGFWAMRRVKKQEDYFMGGRSFGKLLQTFAAFGAGTSSSDPVNTARTTFTSGMSGMWSVMYWLFVTPFYWITGVWYRRMRHLTLGDWFVERYESKRLGAAYAGFGLLFYMVYSSMAFTAVGKVAASLLEIDAVVIAGSPVALEYLLVPLVAVIVVVYGVLGGLTAAYWTDLIQGVFIILLSVLLLPFGLHALVRRFGREEDGLLAGFRILHEQVPPEFFDIVGSTSTSEFPLYRIIAVVVINLIGIVVVPHFIATGGGSAKSELDARVGLVMGNFFKRFCTVGWALTALIVLALMAGDERLAADPDKAWGVASLELLPAGLVGLMLACLLAALMSSVDCYMIVCSALVVRNVYVPFVKEDATERDCLRVGRISGFVMVLGSVVIALTMNDVFKQLQLTWIVPLVFAAPFWLGNWWRRATTTAVWVTVVYSTVVFFVVPQLVPRLTSASTSERWAAATDIVETTTFRAAAPSDVARRDAAIRVWNKAAPEERDGAAPAPLTVGEQIPTVARSGGKPIYFSGAITPIDGGPPLEIVTVSSNQLENGFVVRKRIEGPRRATGAFKIDNLVYDWAGVPLERQTDAMLDTLSLPFKIVVPFLVMVLVSLLTRRNREETLDRYYRKMKTPVLPDPDEDAALLQRIHAGDEQPVRRAWFPGSSWEIQKPTVADVVGFVVSLAVCFAIIGLAAMLAGIGG